MVSKKFHSDIIDAVLYAFKESPAFTYRAPGLEPAKGTPEANKAIQEKMFELELQGMLDEQERLAMMQGYEYQD